MNTQLLVGLVKILRPKQWIKNGFVFGPLIFSGLFKSLAAVKTSFFAAVLFCIASSAVYIVNDISDIDSDKKHSNKSKNRPLALGIISISNAYILLITLYLLLMCGLFFLPNVWLVILTYLLLNFLYTFHFKYVPVLDIFFIAIGFVLRVAAGTEALDLEMSSWIFITTLCLALYLASIKRRQELILNEVNSRKVLEKYSISLVERYAEISVTGALIFYSLFVMSEKPQLIITIPFVLFGLYRYWYIVEQEKGGESPTDTVFFDKPLFFAILLWIVICIYKL
jgi:decaprenyl-phosphate phosphoribosyltransferase